MSLAQQEFDFPDDRAYDRVHHMWARLDGATNRVRVGIDQLGLTSLGDLAYVAFHEVGTVVQRGDSIGTLEAAKMTGDFLSPIAGVLVERNEEALRNPYSVNEQPYQGGWLVVIEAEDWSRDSAELVSGEQLPQWVASEIERYKSEGWIE